MKKFSEWMPDNKTRNVISACISAVTFCFAAVSFPSLASVLLLVVGAASLPLKPVRSFLERIKITGKIKVIILAALFIVAALIAPDKSGGGAVVGADTSTDEIQSAYSESVESEPTETKPAESKPTETKPVETKPVETKPVETEPAETKSAETKPAETKPAETKPAETKPAETKPTETERPETEPLETEPAETKPAETKPAETEPPETEPIGAAYILNIKTKTIHSPGCWHIEKILPENYAEYFGSIGDLIAQGYKKCGTCEPH